MATDFWTSPYVGRHENCEVYVDIFPRDKNGKLITIHAAALRCRTHNKLIKWLSLVELAELKDLAEDQ